MLTFTSAGNPCCDGVRRRDFLKVGGLGALGLPELLRMRAAHATQPPNLLPQKGRGSSTFGRAKRCLLLFMFGGPPHQDTFDLKPDAPAEVRGEFKPISTNVPGIQICELLPQLARVADKYAIIRSVTHPSNAHSASAHHMLTGNIHPNPAGENLEPKPNDWPTFGSSLTKLRPSTKRLPTFVSLPWKVHNTGGQTWPGQGGGFLGAAYDPFRVNVTYPRLDDTPKHYEGLPFKVEDIVMPDGLSVARMQARRSLLDSVGRGFQRMEQFASVRNHDAFYEHALELVTSPEAQRAFDLSLEPATSRERYSQHIFGQGVLMAKRLLEAGVPLVTVYWAQDGTDAAPAWDTHAKNFHYLRTRLLPPTDRVLSTVLSDLSASGLLEETLVVWMGEFGRTPKINPSAGRDHWGACQSVVMAGAGIRGGQVIGASDATAAYPTDNPISPGDLAATIYHLIGLAPDTEIRDQLDRPVPLARGRVVTELFG